MGATRKLQGEIERVLKKVQEGVDVFDSIWNKVYDTENANQKEKFEADLKKEIKKLQRYRDQIKTWIQSSEIKDKKVNASYEQALLDARKLIEREMERFKVCEKETKTKAFSKEGLGQQPKTDPREKAKGETRDWLNNMVGELESQLDSFEAEMEGLSVKKGKSRPPRLTHLEESISRHKAHIVKLEQILRLLDNDELSPEQVNDVRDFVEDYVERNQDDFEDFDDVDEFYSSLPLDKMEALENLDAVPIVAPAVVVKEKGQVANIAAVAVAQQVPSSSQVPEEVLTQDNVGETGTRTPPMPAIGSNGSQPDVSAGGIGTGLVIGPVATPVPAARGLGVGSLSALITSSTSVRGVTKTNSPSVPSSPVSVSKEEEGGSLMGRRVGPGIAEVGLARNMGRETVKSSVGSVQSSPLVSGGMGAGALSSGGVVVSSGLGVCSPIADLSKRTGLVGDERLVSGQQITSPLGSQNRVFLQPGTKLADGSGGTDSSSGTEGGIIGGRIYTPTVVSGGQWRPHTASSFQTPTEQGQIFGRPEIAPDQKQKFLQRLQQVHQQQHSAALLSQKQQQVLPSQQTALSQEAQLQLLQNQQVPLLQASALQQQQQQQQQPGLPLGVQAHSISGATQQSQQNTQQQTLQAQQSSTAQTSQQILLPVGASGKENESASGRIAELQQQNPQHKLLDDVNTDTSALSAAFTRPMFVSDDDLKNADTFDVPVGGPGTLVELSQLSSNLELSQPVQPTQPSAGPGVIGRRSGADVGVIGENLPGSTAGHDQLYNLQMLEASYHKIPLPKDSERSRNYIPRHPAVTPSSYPQVPVPIIDNPAFWERLDTDVLFFAFYYQQGTYQQYLAARELKKQSWRYHKKYNTWFQRHEEPKVTTDEYEQGTYVYFDFHIVHDDFQQGWCQRIKTEFTFEYSYLEDELVV